MKLRIFTLLLFSTVGLLSCRKSTNDVDIKQYDEQEIRSYIAANGLTGFTRDPSGGDTTGIYYKILSPGTGKTVAYSDVVSLVFTMKTFDGALNVSDTISTPALSASLNNMSPHVYNYLGHIGSNNLPSGVELAIINILKQKGGRMRVLIPSRLAFGKNGYGSGSSSSGSRIAGNQCLDMYINLINTDAVVDPATGLTVNGQSYYDDISVKKYMTANNLTGYTQITSGTYKGLWYKVTQASTGAAITNSSLVVIQYTTFTFNGLIAESFNYTDATYGETIDMATEMRKGLVGGLLQVTPGTKLSLVMPSRLAYGNSAGTGSVPVFSCLRYEINVISSTN